MKSCDRCSFVRGSDLEGGAVGDVSCGGCSWAQDGVLGHGDGRLTIPPHPAPRQGVSAPGHMRSCPTSDDCTGATPVSQGIPATLLGGAGLSVQTAVTLPASPPHQEMLKYSKSCEGAEDLQEALSSILGILKAVNDSMHLIAITGYEVRPHPSCQPGAGPEGAHHGRGVGVALHAHHPESHQNPVLLGRPAAHQQVEAPDVSTPGCVSALTGLRDHPLLVLPFTDRAWEPPPPGPPLLAEAAPDSEMLPLRPWVLRPLPGSSPLCKSLQHSSSLCFSL